MAVKMVVLPGLLLLLIVVVAAIVGVIALWRKSTVAGVVALGVTAVVVLLALFAISILTVRPARYVPAEVMNEITITSGEAWLEAVDEQFEADVYPSTRAAARALGRQLLRQLNNAMPNRQKSSGVVISVADFEGAKSVRAEVTAVLQTGEYGIHHMGQEPVIDVELGSDMARLHIEMTERSTKRAPPWAGGEDQVSGTLQATFRGEAGQSMSSARFIEKPWAASYAAFVSNYPSRPWILGRSATFAETPNGAHEFAIQDAARQLTPRVLEMVNRHRAERHLVPLPIGQEKDVTYIIAGRLRDNAYVLDRFTQCLKRPYGNVWREAILLDAQPEQLSQLAGRIVGSEGQMRSAWLGAIASIMGLLMLICGVYLFLSIATKGYYDWALRLVLIIIALVCVGGVLLIA